ncbi:ABC transporter permease, partial [Streptomyces sp. NPDC057499]
MTTPTSSTSPTSSTQIPDAPPAAVDARDTVVQAATDPRVPLTRVCRFELVKAVSQWRTRLLVLACWIAPGLFVAAVSQQSTLPTDTLFGRWMLATGWAGPLVVLGFAGIWALPLLT